jgi:carboxylesterase type B
MRKKKAAVAASKKAPAKKSAKKQKPEATETASEPAPVETVVEETSHTEAKVTPVKKGRDNSVYIYQGAEYKKGRLVHKIISDHVAAAKGKMTYEQLRSAFPESIQKRFNVFKKEAETQALNSAGRERFFSKPEELIKLKNATIAVTNQWTAQSLAPFLKVAASLGYKVKVK